MPVWDVIGPAVLAAALAIWVWRIWATLTGPVAVRAAALLASVTALQLSWLCIDRSSIAEWSLSGAGALMVMLLIVRGRPGDLVEPERRLELSVAEQRQLKDRQRRVAWLYIAVVVAMSIVYVVVLGVPGSSP